MRYRLKSAPLCGECGSFEKRDDTVPKAARPSYDDQHVVVQLRLLFAYGI
jgi:hypothetical protein